MSNEWVQVISNLGFPIVCCIAMGWYVKYMTDKHQGEIDGLKETIDSNTQVITEMKAMVQTFMDYMAKMNNEE